MSEPSRESAFRPIPLPDLDKHDLPPDERQRMEFMQDMIKLGGELLDDAEDAPEDVVRVRLSARTFSRLALMADGLGFGKDWGVEIVVRPGDPEVAMEFVLLPECSDALGQTPTT